MNDTTDFDRLVASWLQGTGPADIRREAVDGALVTARRASQRRGPVAWVLGPAGWPAFGPRRGFTTLPPVARVALLLALAISLALGAVLAGGGRLAVTPVQPTPSQSPSPVPSVEPTSGFAPLAAPPVYAGPFDVILLRPIDGTADEGLVDVVGVRADGTERVLRRLDDRGYSVFGDVAPDGWLAVSLSGPGLSLSASIFRLIDLSRPELEPTDMPYAPVIGGSWAPGGVFATTTGGAFDITATDANTGDTLRLGRLALPGSGPSLLWAADRTGILVRRSDGRYGIAPLGVGPVVPGIPALAPRKYPRSWAERAALDFDLGAGTVDTTDGIGGPKARRYAGELGGTLRGASLSADGRSIWILVSDATGRAGELSLARIAPDDTIGIVAVAQDVARADTGIFALAPDDSLLVLQGGLSGTVAERTFTLVQPSGDSRVLPKGSPIGFLPSGLVDAIPVISP